MRERILLHLLEHEEASAAELARAWDVPTSTVAYHLRRLATFGLVREVRQVARRGASEHRYALTPSDRPQLTAIFRRDANRRTTVADIGTALRSLRERRGRNCVHVARAVGLEVDEVVAIEEGRENPRLQTLIDLAASLDASLVDIVA